jgi:trimeric autotransporter adhesin
MNPLIQLKKATPPFLGVFVLVCLTLSPRVQAVVPPPDGGYPNFTTAEGTNALKNLTTGVANTAVGWFSLFSDTTSSFNTATGAGALLFNTADENTAFGAAALLFNTTGINNTAVGTATLSNNTTAEGNTATGAFALYSNTEGDFNTADGEFALYFNTTGVRNTATGDSALFSNTTGNQNTATGNAALVVNTTGGDNTANGASALSSNTAGNDNTANGFGALRNNTTGSENTATGFQALLHNTTGTANTANGVNALFNTSGTRNTAMGNQTLEHSTTGNFNTALGDGAGNNVTTADNVIAIGTAGDNVSDSTWINNIYGTVTVSGATLPVIVSNTGQLGTTSSSRRFKKEIKPMDKTSEAILGLKPVTFHYKSDSTGTPQFGLIAEEVAAMNPDLVVRDKNGEIYTVRYEAVNAMLLNEFLKEHRKVEQQRKDFEAALAQQQKQIDTLTTGLQKVSAQLELRKPAPQTVLNSQ